MFLSTVKRLFVPLTLSRALEIVRRMHRDDHGREPVHFDHPVAELIEQVGDVPIADVTPDHLRAWLRHLQTRPRRHGDSSKKLSPWTVDHYGRAMRAFWNHLVEMGHLDRSPWRGIALPRLPKKRKREVDPEAIEKLVEGSKYDLRNHAIVLVLRDSGCRIGELCTITVDNITFTESGGRAWVHGAKMHKSRWIYFGRRAAKAIRHYLDTRPANAGDCLWVSQRGGPLSSGGVHQMLKTLSKRLGLNGVTAHGFRHALAKRMQNEGAPARLIQEILGHEDVHTTQMMYITYDDEELEEVFQAYLPDDAPGSTWFEG